MSFPFLVDYKSLSNSRPFSNPAENLPYDPPSPSFFFVLPSQSPPLPLLPLLLTACGKEECKNARPKEKKRRANPICVFPLAQQAGGGGGQRHQNTCAVLSGIISFFPPFLVSEVLATRGGAYLELQRKRKYLVYVRNIYVLRKILFGGF